MIRFFECCLVMAGLGLIGLPALAHAEDNATGTPPVSAFARFHDKASRGDPVTVVFLGGSLTWGANASDPNQTSYRALMGQYLQDRYPRTPVRVVDAAIGGTGSDLAFFRLDRDVFAYDPDLVFIEFVINDEVTNDNPLQARFYESCLRRLLERDIAVFQAGLAVKWILGKDFQPDGHPRARQYAELAKTYNTPWVNVAPYVQARTSAPEGPSLDACWPIEATHPVDEGYRMFFEAVRDGFEAAMKKPPVATVPAQPVYDGGYVRADRVRVADGGALPDGWSRAITFRTSMWFDGLTSRWMDSPVALCDLAAARAGKSLKMDFEGTAVGIFGEMDADSLDFEVRIDGERVDTGGKRSQPRWTANSKRMGGGRLFFWRRLAVGLAPGKHTLEIIPLAPEDAAPKATLRIESVCVASNEPVCNACRAPVKNADETTAPAVPAPTPQE